MTNPNTPTGPLSDVTKMLAEVTDGLHGGIMAKLEQGAVDEVSRLLEPFSRLVDSLLSSLEHDLGLHPAAPAPAPVTPPPATLPAAPAPSAPAPAASAPETAPAEPPAPYTGTAPVQPPTA